LLNFEIKIQVFSDDFESATGIYMLRPKLTHVITFPEMHMLPHQTRITNFK